MVAIARWGGAGCDTSAEPGIAGRGGALPCAAVRLLHAARRATPPVRTQNLSPLVGDFTPGQLAELRERVNFYAAKYAARRAYAFPIWATIRQMGTRMDHVTECRYPVVARILGNAAG